jgi:hypothetical protein
VQKIRQTLDGVFPVQNSPSKTAELFARARQDFYQLALMLAEEDR